MFVPLGEETEYYLPAGQWTSFFNPARKLTGPLWVKEHVLLDEIPVWVRAGTVLLLGPQDIGRPDYDYTQGLEVRAYGLQDGDVVDVDVPLGKGTEVVGTVSVSRKKEGVEVDVKGPIQVASKVAY